MFERTIRRAFVLLALLTACSKTNEPAAPKPIGNAENGKALIARYGCTMCHGIPGVEGPRGNLGPALDHIGSQPAISNGTVKVTPETLVKFVQNPQSVNPQSSMPPLGLTEPEARDVTAYLLTLK